MIAEIGKKYRFKNDNEHSKEGIIEVVDILYTERKLQEQIVKTIYNNSTSDSFGIIILLEIL